MHDLANRYEESLEREIYREGESSFVFHKRHADVGEQNVRSFGICLWGGYG